MNKYYYSAKNNGFYNSSINGKMPNDATEISTETYNELMKGQADGQSIVSDKTGEPILTNQPPSQLHCWNVEKQNWIISDNDKKKLVEQNKTAALLLKQNLMKEASSKIAILTDAVELDIATTEDVEQLKVWRKYRVLLDRVDILKEIDINWPQQPE